MIKSAILIRAEPGFDPTDAGVAIRKLRVARGWTLKALAERSGISLSMLSRIENGQCGVSIYRAHTLAKAFDITAADLLTQMSGSAPPVTPASRFQGWRSFTPAGTGKHVGQGHADFEQLCSDFLHRQIVGSLVEIKARSLAEHGPMLAHPGERFVFVIQGPVVFATVGFEDLVLNAGDSLQFDSSILHAFFKSGNQDGRLLLIASAARAEANPGEQALNRAEPGNIPG